MIILLPKEITSFCFNFQLYSATYWICAVRTPSFSTSQIQYNQLVGFSCLLYRLYNKNGVFRLFFVIEMPRPNHTDCKLYQSSPRGIFLGCASFSLSIYFYFGLQSVNSLTLLSLVMISQVSSTPTLLS